MIFKTWTGRTLVVVLAGITIAAAFSWINRTAIIDYATTANVVQCLYEEGGSFSGQIENTVFDEKRGCYAMTYQIPRSLDYIIIPSYGHTRESLRIELPYTGDVSDQLYQISGVRGNVLLQVRPWNFKSQLDSRIRSSNRNGLLQVYDEDERFLANINGDTRRYLSISDDYPFFISCTMRRGESGDYTEHFICQIRTKTCNGLMLLYTTIGNPFNRLDEVDAIHQRQVRPLFDHCD